MGARCYLLAGEHSGDVHGAALMESLRALSGNEITFAGLGGPRMCEAGGEGMTDWIGEAAVVGLWEVLKKYAYFKKRFTETVEEISTMKPEAVILIDYPGFNLRLARVLRQEAYKGKIAYYISPQVWAWNRKRIPVMASLLDLMICIFPFEKPLYEDSGLETIFAGHPLIDELEEVPAVPREKDLLGLFPGSREREVRKLFPMMLQTAAILQRERPGLRAMAAAANPRLAETMRGMAETAAGSVEVTTGKAHQLMQRATAGAVASGTATLEAALLGLPYCLVYRVAWPTYLVGKTLVKIKFLGIVNILAGREVVKELIQGEAKPSALAAELRELLEVPEKRSALQSELAEAVARLGEPGTHGRAAGAILHLLEPDAR